MSDRDYPMNQNYNYGQETRNFNNTGPVPGNGLPDFSPNYMGQTGMNTGRDIPERDLGRISKEIRFEKNLHEGVFTADVKPEVYFTGQISIGENFVGDGGFCCELLLEVGDGWELFDLPMSVQTQTCYTQPGLPLVW